MRVSCIQVLGSLSLLIEKAVRSSRSGEGRGIAYFNMYVANAGCVI